MEKNMTLIVNLKAIDHNIKSVPTKILITSKLIVYHSDNLNRSFPFLPTDNTIKKARNS
jgi:hypothetical protein